MNELQLRDNLGRLQEAYRGHLQHVRFVERKLQEAEAARFAADIRCREIRQVVEAETNVTRSLLQRLQVGREQLRNLRTYRRANPGGFR